MSRAHPLRRGHAAALLLAGLTAACATEAPPPAPGARVYYGDLQGGAQTCTVPKDVKLAAGEQADAAMTVGNDGGWCGIAVAQPGPKPFDAALLVVRPKHGRVLVRKVGDVSRVDYFPDAAFGGADTFTVRMLPGNGALRVAVTVQYTPPPAPPAPPPAPVPSQRRRR